MDIRLLGPFEPGRLEAGLSGRPASPGGEQAFGLWMRTHHLTAQYVTDVELGRLPPDVLRRYAVVVFPGHTEYYEPRTYSRLLAYRNAGGRLYFLQGNSFYGEVSVGRSTITRLSYRYRTRTRSDSAALHIRVVREQLRRRNDRPSQAALSGPVRAWQ